MSEKELTQINSDEKMYHSETGNFIFYDNQGVNEKYIQKIRVFNADKEFHAWRTQQGFNGRVRKDDVQGTGTDVVVAQQVLVGTKAEGKGKEGFTEISEDRGSRLVLPFENIKFDKDGKLVSPICIKTHNYIGYNDANQATYVDCRFAEFTDGTDCLQ
jgi:CRISPR-associated protein (TIGR03984 family)